jgi:hypothetical protein
MALNVIIGRFTDITYKTNEKKNAQVTDPKLIVFVYKRRSHIHDTLGGELLTGGANLCLLRFCVTTVKDR